MILIMRRVLRFWMIRQPTFVFTRRRSSSPTFTLALISSFPIRNIWLRLVRTTQNIFHALTSDWSYSWLSSVIRAWLLVGLNLCCFIKLSNLPWESIFLTLLRLSRILSLIGKYGPFTLRVDFLSRIKASYLILWLLLVKWVILFDFWGVYRFVF